ncbi:Glycosyltransferase family 25 (LPS biosynthesis protein) [uncultured virus]|nr:Glycosyltransferase family 25 (LPS biosynthesis protein) [uncultured virus]
MNKIFKTKVINLDRRNDRWETFEKLAKEKFIIDYERYSAIDGQNLKINESINELFKNNKFNWRKGIMGACLSHFNLWKSLIDDDVDYYLILEDDVKLEDGFEENIKKIHNQISTNYYPFIFLGYTTDKEYIKEFYDHNLHEIIIYKLKFVKHIWGGIFAYFIHKNFAKSLVNDINNNGFIYPADTTILKYDDLYMVSPVCASADYMTVKNNIDSDIQYDILGIKDNYDFYSLKDSPGNDIKYCGKKSVFELKKICDQDDTCVGFNTIGYIKYKIIDSNELINLSENYSKTEGLYVKKKIDN